MIEDLTACFDGLADPRVTRRCDHQLIDILVIAVSAVIACAESREDTLLHGSAGWRRELGGVGRRHLP
jgi:DDE_Tnp_1-associated